MKKFLVLFFILTPYLAFAQTPAPAEQTAVTVQAEAPPPPPADSIESGSISGDVVTFNTDDGIAISAIFHPPSGEQTKYAILLPALGKNRSSYAPFTKELIGNEVGFLAIDLRGHGKSATYMHYSKFAKTGIDNEFNRMYKDVNAAVNYLKSRGVKAGDIFVIGAGLGANVAASSIVFNNDIGGFALLTPNTNTRDVLTIPGVKVSKVPLLIAVAPNVRKNFLEASLIRNTAYIAQGPGKITFLTAYDKEGADMLNAYLGGHVVQWILTPALPEVIDDRLPKLEGLPTEEDVE
ncbi:pimeloyl-ACP methyl ester carboxylesterase [Elusimicrobium posterum]|uniref:serine aminopeptidase domain-containing protein n=1 Tax=Elusimicrobium posterum TaxID=3116653 RepID=UPI003C734570